MSFDYSTVKIGDGVEIKTEYNSSEWVSGKVVQVSSAGAHIAMDGSRFAPLEHCWHEDDHRLEGGPDRFQASYDLLSGKKLGGVSQTGPRTGIFRMARSQILLNEMPVRLAALERLCAALSARLTAMEDAGSTSPADPLFPPRRRPGRLKKGEQPQPVMG